MKCVLFNIRTYLDVLVCVKHFALKEFAQKVCLSAVSNFIH